MGSEQSILETFSIQPSNSCNPSEFNLKDYPQWEAETGYWIGAYSFYGPDGKPFESTSWNYPYDNYIGFITGNVNGPSYRQRNVFVSPPQILEKCSENKEGTIGEGECGKNGNTRIFEADQTVTTCPAYPNEEGDIEGVSANVFNTTTELIGKDNAILYQVYYGDCLFQSQLTTLVKNYDKESVSRVRTAQGFECFDPERIGEPVSSSFYREQRVSKEIFYLELNKAFLENNILESDICAWDGAGNPSAYHDSPGFASCVKHLEESFDLGKSSP